jgi:hypothetical protein
MSLVHYVRPFLELGICKEYSMARKTTGNTTTSRSKKTETSTQPAAVQVAAEVPKVVEKTEVAKEVRKNGKSASGSPAKLSVNLNLNIEEEIRLRAYELYLERRATAGGANGDENHDWLMAEREIRSRQPGGERHTA